MKQKFAGEIAWITGGGTGIGRALALELARQGASVAISGRRADRIEEVAAEIERAGGKAAALVCDVEDAEQIEATVAAVVSRFGKLDMAIANAGYAVGGKVESLRADEWRRQFNVNVVGAALTARYALPELRKSNGRLGLVGSVVAFICPPGSAAYTASKHALRAIGQTLAVELHGSGVSCTTVHPGYVQSEIAQVDNDGVFHAERRDKRPAKLMWTSERAAEIIVRALHKRRREVVFTGHGKLGAFIGQHLPSVAHLFLRAKR